METIRKIAKSETLFFENDWFLGSDKLVAIHEKDKSTKQKIKDGFVLCSFRKNNGSGDQYQVNISDNTELENKK